MAPARTDPFMYVLKTTYVKGRGPQRTRKVILITFNNLILVSDTYETATGFRQGNETGTPAAPVAIRLSQVIPEPIRDATVRIIPPTTLLYDTFGAVLGARFNALGFIQVDVVSFVPSTTVLVMKCVGALNGAVGPILEPPTAVGGDKITGNLVIEVEFTTNSGAEA